MSVRLSGESATPSTKLSSARVRSSLPLDASQILIVLSRPPDEAMVRPSGENATSLTGPTWPDSACSMPPLDASQIFGVGLADTMVRPSGDIFAPATPSSVNSNDRLSRLPVPACQNIGDDFAPERIVPPSGENATAHT